MNRRGLSVVAGSVDAPRVASASIISIATEPLFMVLYRVKSGKLTSVFAVRDAGIRLEYDGDSPTKRALLDTYIRPGHARTCISEGLIALGARAYRDITLDGEGSDLEQLRVMPWMLAGAVDEIYVGALQTAGLFGRAPGASA